MRGEVLTMNSQQTDREPPHDDDAEAAVLGASLLAADRVMPLASALAIDDFFLPHHREAWAAIVETFGRRMPVDVISVGDEVRARAVGSRFPGGWASWALTTANAVS